jgi:DNA-binding beta-propeller fold protein YncE
MKTSIRFLFGAGLTMLAGAANAQIAVTANDNHWTLENGVQVAIKNPKPDNVSIIDLSAKPPKLLAELDAPASVIGPPQSVAVSPDESIAIVTSAQKLDPKDPTKQIPDNRISVIDLQAKPPKVIAKLEAGLGPSGVSFNRAGTLALVANRNDGSVSIYMVEGKVVSPAGMFQVAPATAGVSHVVFTPDGTRVLVTRDGDHMITVLKVDGKKLELAGRDMQAGLRPYSADITPDGAVLVTGNVGPGTGDSDTISVVDVKANPPRIVDVIPVGQTPEAVDISPDGKFAAVLLQNGSNKVKESPFFNDFGLVRVYRIDGTKFTHVADGKLGHWSQGVTFTADSKMLVVTNMIEKNVQFFNFDGAKLTAAGQPLQLTGAPAAIRIADK